MSRATRRANGTIRGVASFTRDVTSKMPTVRPVRGICNGHRSTRENAEGLGKMFSAFDQTRPVQSYCQAYPVRANFAFAETKTGR